MAMGITYYSILGVKNNASDVEIKTAYRRLIMICHPDKTGGEQHLYDIVTKAYEVLSDPQQRRACDERMRNSRSNGAGRSRSGFGGYRRDEFRSQKDFSQSTSTNSSESKRRCTHCDGFGYDSAFGPSLTCLYCDGNGWVPGRKF